MSSFWGKVIKPGKQPTPLRDEDSQLVMVLKQAALAPDAAKLSTTEPSTLSVSVGGKKETFVLCHLTPGKCEQWAIDLGFDADDEVFFHLTGKCPVHLTGFYEEPDEEDWKALALPQDKGCILMFNHTSMFDGFLMASTCVEIKLQAPHAIVAMLSP